MISKRVSNKALVTIFASMCVLAIIIMIIWKATEEDREYNRKLAEARDTTEELSMLYDKPDTDKLIEESEKRRIAATDEIINEYLSAGEYALSYLEKISTNASIETKNEVLQNFFIIYDHIGKQININTELAVLTYEEIFAETETLTEEKETELLDKFVQKGLENHSVIDEAYEAIEVILEHAWSDKRTLTTDETIDIAKSLDIMIDVLYNNLAEPEKALRIK